MSQPENSKGERVQIIEAVQTPLGFFVLASLIVEALLVVVAGLSQGSDRTLAIIGMIATLLLLIILVAVLAVYRPEALKGRRPIMRNNGEFKKGDLVRVSSKIVKKTVITADGPIEWKPAMSSYIGHCAKIVEVNKVTPVTFRLDLDNGSYEWSPTWLEHME